MTNIRVIWETMRLQMKNSFVRPMFRFCMIASPIVNTILIYEMFRNSGQVNFSTYVIMGAGLMSLWSCICFSSAGDINRERWTGTLSIIFSAPAKFQTIILGKILGNTILSMMTLVITMVTAKLLFHVSLRVESWGYLLVSILATIVCFVIVSIVIAYLLTLSRKTTLYMNCIEIPIELICGFVFPIEVLPDWVLPISYMLPPTWAIKLLRMSVAGITNANDYVRTFEILAGLIVLYTILAGVLYKIIDKQVRIRASLEVS
ncbi:MAG: type transporter [Herbinix sp.]|jgi:ABC-2 type transport system permease protein|nr:type transporter [Herbinix sp.]